MPYSMPPARPTLRDPLISQRNPFEVYLLFIALVVSVLSLFGVKVSVALDVQSTAVVFLWSVMVAVGSLAGLFGVLLPLSVLGISLQLERFGMILMAGGVLVYAALAAHSQGFSAVWASGVNTAFGLACINRVVQITRRYKWYSRYRGTNIGYDSPFREGPP